MQEGSFEETLYIVRYNVRGRAEGGPIDTRHFVDLLSAFQHVDYVKQDPDISDIQIWKQESTIKRSRIH